MPLSPNEEALLGSVGLPTQGTLRIPGPTHESARAVQEALQENHVKFDWQFTKDGLHNHLSHGILASYSLGASPDMIRDNHTLHAMEQRPMCPLQNVRISFQNWTRWLGKDEFYSTYLAFFIAEIAKYGAAATMERYLFKVRDGQLLMRTVSGALHPLIQMGYGVEFGLDALVAEGLAQACVHSNQVSQLFPSTWPNLSGSTTNSPFANAFSRLGSLRNVSNAFNLTRDSFLAVISRLDPARPRHPRQGLSGFTILSHMLRDPRLAAGQANQKDDFPRLGKALENRGDIIRAWCEEWVVEEQAGWVEIVEKTEELFWIATVIVGASSRPGFRTRLDFFLMHALTSVLFLPSMLEILSPANRIALLHSHFRVMTGYWISRGRPYLYIKDVLMAATAYPEPPNARDYSESATQRALSRGGTDLIHMRDESLEKEGRLDEKPEIRTEANGAAGAHEEADGQDGKPNGPIHRIRSDSESTTSEVDVPLDSPALESENQLNAKEHLFVNVDGEADDEGVRTPRVSQGRSPSPEASGQGQRQPRVQSSAAVWGNIIASVQDHTDCHTTKMARSLAFAAQNFGMAPAGVYASGVPGTEIMDGSIFIRLAGMLMDTMGWAHEGQECGDWDRSVLGFDEAWREEAMELGLSIGAHEQGKDMRLNKGKGRAQD